jgi:hypothetical protein
MIDRVLPSNREAVCRHASVAQLDRASASGAEGRGFESRQTHNDSGFTGWDQRVARPRRGARAWMWSTSSGGSWPRNSWPISATCTASSSLMARLGYDRYGAQGGDIGVAVAPQPGRVARDHVVGVHVNGGP